MWLKVFWLGLPFLFSRAGNAKAEVRLMVAAAAAARVTAKVNRCLLRETSTDRKSNEAAGSVGGKQRDATLCTKASIRVAQGARQAWT